MSMAIETSLYHLPQKGSETADKLTHRQIAAKVRQYFEDKSGWQED